MLKRIQMPLITALTAIILTACAGMSGRPSYSVPAMSGTWQDIGAINQRNIVVAYEKGSIRRNGDIAYLRDRKIVVNPNEESYTDTPKYKIAVSDWEFHCKNRSYRLSSVKFLDEQGKLIGENHFSPTQIRHMPFNNGTIAEKQFNIACK